MHQSLPVFARKICSYSAGRSFELGNCLELYVRKMSIRFSYQAFSTYWSLGYIAVDLLLKEATNCVTVCPSRHANICIDRAFLHGTALSLAALITTVLKHFDCIFWIIATLSVVYERFTDDNRSILGRKPLLCPSHAKYCSQENFRQSNRKW